MNFGRHRKKLIALAVAVLAIPTAHLGIVLGTRIEPPPIPAPKELSRRDEANIQRVGNSYARMQGAVREVYLEGAPETIGDHHARLLRHRMIARDRPKQTERGLTWLSMTRS